MTTQRIDGQLYGLPPNHLRPVGKVLTVRQTVDIPILGGASVAQFISFNGLPETHQHLTIRLGQPNDEAPLVRLHSECMTGDVFGSQRCDCGPQLLESLRNFSEHGGYLLYLRHEGRGIGLYAKLDAYQLQSSGLDTYEANRRLGFDDDLRDYADAANMLKALGITRIRLISNNPEKHSQLADHGIEVVERLPTGVYVNAHNRNYLSAKRQMGHDICLSEALRGDGANA